MSINEYESWLSTNKKILEADFSCNNQTSFKLEYVPIEFNRIKIGINEDLNEEFILTIEVPKDHNIVSDPSILFSYTELYLYEELKLVQGQDTLTCASTILEAGLTNNQGIFKIIILFNGQLKKNSKSIKVLYDDHLFGCNKQIEFSYPDLKITKLPKIKK